MPSLTGPQKYAVYADHGNLLVSAAAGSGKTFTLSSHIAELIRSGKAGIDEMLVVTFTRASALDMKRKIGDKLSSAAKDAKGEDPAAYGRLVRAASAVPSADISTIHSFLYGILKKHFSSLSLPEDSRLISNRTIVDRMKSEAMRETTGELFETADEDFLMLADILATVRETDTLDRELYALAVQLTNNGLDHTALGRYADLCEQTVTDSDAFLSSPFGEPLKNAVAAALRHFTEVFSVLSEELVGEDPAIAAKFGEECAALLGWLGDAEKMLAAGDIGALREATMTFSRPRLSSSKKETGELTKEFRYQRDEMKTAVAALAKKLGRFLPEEICLSRDGTIKILRCAEKVLGKYFSNYEKRKRDLSMLDYSDLEKLAYRLLVGEDGQPTAAAREIGTKYKYIFIDEYQDTNRVQDAVFSALSGNARRFMVGDIKQAIYRFRGADPSVFSEYRTMWREVSPETDASDSDRHRTFSPDDGLVLHMSDNFRSTEPVLNLANAVSDSILPFGGIPYGDGDRLICSRDGGDDAAYPDSEVVLIEKKHASRGAQTDEDDTDDENPEIEYIADRIASMVGRQMGERIVRPGDIAVLLRTGDKINALCEAIEKRGVPAFADREKPLAESPAVMLMMCILNFIDNPLRDVYAAGALRSPVFGFDLTDLVKLREYAGEMPLWLGAVRCASGEGADTDSVLREKCAEAVSFIGREKTVSRGMNVKKYLEYLVDALSVFSLDGIRENGGERDAVNRFFEMATEYDAGTADLSSFIDYAAETLASDENNEDKPSSSREAVSVLTIHKSKGLEFPVCFVSDCGKALTAKKDASATLVFDKDLGVGMYLPDVSGLARCDTAFRVSVSEKILRENIAEEMRVLYVALTRATDKLIVTAKVQSLDRFVEPALHGVIENDGYDVMNASKYIDWIYRAVEKKHPPRVSVTMYADGEKTPFAADFAATKNTAVSEAAEKDCLLYEERTSFVYPHAHLSRIPSKLTVSKLSPTILDDREEGEETADITRALDRSYSVASPLTDGGKIKKPAFMTGGKWATASEKGSATHVFMQFADFGRLKKYGAKAELDRLVEEKYISRESAALVNLKQIERFEGSALMAKLNRSPFVKREFRFNVRMDAADFTEDGELKRALGKGGVKVTVQGVVDCVYRDPDTGELVLIDYKTDAMTAEELRDERLAEEKLRSRHANQLTYYKKICAEMFGEPISHAYVYSTVLGKTVEV